MKKLLLPAALAAALLVPASAAHAVPLPNYGHCVKTQAQSDIPLVLTPSEFNALFNPPKSQGNPPGSTCAQR